MYRTILKNHSVGSVLIVVALILFTSAPVTATTTVVDVNTVITSGSYDVLVVEGEGTVLQVQGGTINDLVLVDTAEGIVTSGQISNLVAFDASQINISSGTVSNIELYQTAALDISGTASISGIVSNGGNQIIVGGSPTIGSISPGNNTQMTISFASVPAQWTRLSVSSECFVLAENARLRLQSLSATGTLVVNGCILRASDNDFDWPISMGGDLYVSNCDLNFSNFSISGKIHVIGNNLNVRPYGGTWDVGQVTGQWENETPLAFSLPRRNDYQDIVFHGGSAFPRSCPPQTDLTNDFKVDLQDLIKLTSEWLVDSTVAPAP